MKYKFQIMLAASIIIGVILGWMDSSPNWDDTALIVFAVLTTSAVFGFIMPSRAWLWAIIVGVWIPLFNLILHHNYESIIAIGIALIGSYAGSFIRKLF